MMDVYVCTISAKVQAMRLDWDGSFLHRYFKRNSS